MNSNGWFKTKSPDGKHPGSGAATSPLGVSRERRDALADGAYGYTPEIVRDLIC